MPPRLKNQDPRFAALLESRNAKIPRRSSNDAAQNVLPVNIVMQPESIAPVGVADASYQATSTTQRPREPGFSSSRSSFSSTSSDDRCSITSIAAQTTPRGDGRSSVSAADASMRATSTTQRPRRPSFSSSQSSFSSTCSRYHDRSISLSTPPEGYAPSSFLPLQNQADASSQHPSKRSRRNGSASGRDSTSSTNSDGRRSSVPLAGRLSHSPPLVYTREGSTSPVSIA